MKNRFGDRLSLCWGSMEGVALRELIECAGQAGFDAITLNSALYQDAIGQGLSDNDIGLLLSDHGVSVSGVDPLFNWLPSSLSLNGSDEISRCTRSSAEEIFHIAKVTGTDLVNAPLGMANPDSEQEIIDAFSNLCERAATADLRVSLEFMPFNQVADLATASRIVTKAGRPNGGIMFDCWHHHRGGGVADDILSIPAEQFFALQMDDAMTEPMTDIVDETLNHRLLPGEGCIDLLSTLKNLKNIGAEFVYDVEVFKAPLRTRPAFERAQIIFSAAHGILQQL